MKAREVLATVAVVVIMVLAFVAGEADTRIVTTTAVFTTTVTFTPANSSGFVVEEVVIQPEILNEMCILSLTNQTTTFLLYAEGGSRVKTTVTTETLTALSTVTIYENATIVSDGSTCTDINSHYNVTQTTMSCPPCA